MTRTIIVTGGAGFIGSALVRHLLAETNYNVVNIDKLTYAGSLQNLRSLSLEQQKRHKFLQLDICNDAAIAEVFQAHNPCGVIHLAAESHVDRSITGPRDFIETNIMGTFVLLENSRRFFESLSSTEKSTFRFHHVSTDEVYGTLGESGAFTETTPYSPNSPYSASKASSDHLVRAWFHTYGLPTVVTNCSNNYGPYQFPEKLIPVTILKALHGDKIPVYGNGANVRDWLYVDDHCSAIRKVFEQGRLGETYNVGCSNDVTNLHVVQTICDTLDVLRPKAAMHHRELISFVKDRPGHDFRYAIDHTKITSELGWKPLFPFESRIRETVQWYIDNLDWCEIVAVNKKV